MKGVSAPKEQELHAFGVHTVADLLDYFPFRYEDYRVRALSGCQGRRQSYRARRLCGAYPVLQRYGKNKSRLTCKVEIDVLLVTAVWFNRHFLKDQLSPGREIILTGKWEQHRQQMTVSESEFPEGAGCQIRDAAAGVFRRRGDYAAMDAQDD